MNDHYIKGKIVQKKYHAPLQRLSSIIYMSGFQPEMPNQSGRMVLPLNKRINETALPDIKYSKMNGY